jgi:hypothetical protein
MIDLHNHLADLLPVRSIALIYSRADARIADAGASLHVVVVAGAFHEGFAVVPAVVGLGCGRQLHSVGWGRNFET